MIIRFTNDQIEKDLVTTLDILQKYIKQNYDLK